jgi:hypothetical protein
MSDSVELFRELVASAMESHPERSRGTAEDAGGLVYIESLPGHDLKDLAL